jgi:hypothetical protein
VLPTTEAPTTITEATDAASEDDTQAEEYQISGTMSVTFDFPPTFDVNSADFSGLQVAVETAICMSADMQNGQGDCVVTSFELSIESDRRLSKFKQS